MKKALNPKAKGLMIKSLHKPKQSFMIKNQNKVSFRSEESIKRGN